MTMVREYFEKVKEHIREYGEKTIVLWECGSFFEIYGLRNVETGVITPPQILEFAKICDFRIASKDNFIDKHQVVMAGFGNHILDKYLTKLDAAGYTLPIYKQEKVAGNGFIRTLRFVSSPGTNLTKAGTCITNNIMCCWIEKYPKPTLQRPYINCGLSNIDIFTGKSNLFEFQRENLHQSTTFDELERFYSIYNPSEIIFITKNFTENEINDIIQFAGIHCSNIRCISLDDKADAFHTQVKNCEKQTYQELLFTHFYPITNYSTFINSLQLEKCPMATFSYCFLLEFVQKHNPALVKKIHEPVVDNLNSRLMLANHSLRQLNIIDNFQHKGQYSSVLTFINRCQTAMGKRELNSRLLHPVTDIDHLNTEYAIIDYALLHYDRLSFIRDHFSQIRDMEKMYRKIFMKHVTPAEFISFYQDIKSALSVFNQIREDAILMEYINKNIPECVEKNCKLLIDLFERTFDIEKAQDITDIHPEINCFKKGFSPYLDTIEVEHNKAIDGLKKVQQSLCNILMKKEKKKSKKPPVKINITEKSMYGLVCTNRRSKLLEHDKKLPPGTRFYAAGKSNRKIENIQITTLCSKIHRTFSQLKEQLASDYKKFMETMQEYGNNIEVLVKYIILLDVLLSKAYIAKKYKYCRPKIDMTRERASFNAVAIRHPLIEHLQTNEIYVTNDVSLGVDKYGLILFGTNAVGKSSLIRSLGIAVILAQSGMFVPCESFIYKPYTRLFTRILGNDNIFKGLSTFDVEMSELRTILREADENSLILGDELCFRYRNNISH